MIPDGAMWADLFLSVAALIGLGALHRSIAARGRWEPLNRRFIAGIRITMLLFAGRSLVILTGWGVFQPIIHLAAALIPVGVLLLTEGLLRRHAPWEIKAFVAGGALVLGLLSFIPIISPPLKLNGLLTFQIISLLACGWLVLFRDKASLSIAENRAVERLGFSLILLVPLATVDFLTVDMGIPVQASPLAVLFLCWLAIGLGRTEARHRASIASFGAVIGAAIAATVFVALVWDMGRDDWLVAGAVILAAGAVGAIVNEARDQADKAQSLSLLRHLAQAEGDAVTFLRGLAAHPAVDGAVIVGEEIARDLDPATLARLFAKRPVLRRSEPLPDGEESDHAAHLFKRYAASHILWVSGTPLRLLALSMPSVAVASSTELELSAVQRVAALLAKVRE